MFALISLGISLFSVVSGLLGQNEQNKADEAAGQQAVAQALAASELQQLENDASEAKAKAQAKLLLAQQQQELATQDAERVALSQKLLFGSAFFFGLLAMYLFINRRVSA